MNRTGTLDIEGFKVGSANLPKALAQMGYKELRKGQADPINHIMFGRDTICILPTSLGKSACFAIPTIAMGWKTIVFSPLIALMADQVRSMNLKGIRTACVNSGQPDIENYQALRDWSTGDLQMLYVAPERIKNEQFRMAIKAAPPALVVADEAHTISNWSASFRPAYVDIGEFIDDTNPKVVAAFTATATDQVLDDIRRVMRMEHAVLDRYYPRRENLHLSSEYVESDKLIPGKVLELVQRIDGSIIVYCQTVKEVESIAFFLGSNGESVTYYHGQIQNAAEKSVNQDEFMSGSARICVATNAFGMGIDKPDIRAIIHTGPPGSIEAIAQETGRAARDGKDATCHMFYTKQGLFMQEFFFENSNPTSKAVKRAYGIFKEYADSEGVARLTGTELKELTGEKGADAAGNVLESSGCVKRTKEQGEIYTFYVTGLTTDILKPAQKKVYDAVREYGTPSGQSDEGEDIYKIELSYLAGKCGVLPGTMRTKITDLSKTNVMRVKFPFRGKCTQLIHPPSEEDLKAIDERRKKEWTKIQQVRDYLYADDKQQVLEDYFTLSQ